MANSKVWSSFVRPQVLFVDRDGDVWQSLAEVVAECKESWELDLACTPEAVLKKVGSKDYDAIVLDMEMPSTSSFSLLRQIRASGRPKDVPMVLLADRKQPGIKQLLLEDIAIDVVIKPADPLEVMARLRSAIRHKLEWDHS